MDTLKSIVEFFGSYDTWAKLLMISGVVITFGVMGIAPRNQDSQPEPSEPEPEQEKSVQSIFDNNPTKTELISEFYGDKNILIEHLASDSYDRIEILNGIKVNNVSFDMVIYCHNEEMNQIGRRLILVNFYEVDSRNVNWSNLDEDWSYISSNVKWDDVKKSLEATSGFNYALERSTSIGLEKPGFFFLQLYGRRKALNQLDLLSMQNKKEAIEPDSFWRVITTYDFLIEKFHYIM